ncbi:hypothetical protein EUGRSUZ_L01125 [Eucalyptus grandis]|uniref:Uncharacterized protein n=1 Tax=Eucalyptus grandis TaxID=71139 RepID=A0A058ZVZ2_EUCGR|nr:hypothetical protein EUGRSUZ_L01125 [Eucalyptus grandis]
MHKQASTSSLGTDLISLQKKKLLLRTTNLHDFSPFQVYMSVAGREKNEGSEECEILLSDKIALCEN